MKFSIKDFFSKFLADLVTFVEEIRNGKLHFSAVDTKQDSLESVTSNVQHVYDDVTDFEFC